MRRLPIADGRCVPMGKIDVCVRPIGMVDGRLPMDMADGHGRCVPITHGHD
jgi:hypothetical protein